MFFLTTANFMKVIYLYESLLKWERYEFCVDPEMRLTEFQTSDYMGRFIYTIVAYAFGIICAVLGIVLFCNHLTKCCCG